MRFGYFDDQARICHYRPDTPLPWINYLGCEDYFGLISNTAGVLFHKDARLRRLTVTGITTLRSIPATIHLFAGQRSFHRRKTLFWSPTWQPVQTHWTPTSAGTAWATIIRSKLMDIEAQIDTSFRWEKPEIWELNSPTSARQLRNYPSSCT
jgi:cellobiose phosphorylase